MRKPLSERMAREMLESQRSQTEEPDKALKEFLKEMGYTDILAMLEQEEKSRND